MTASNEHNINPFNQDAASNAGYIYTTNSQLSSQFATKRSLETIVKWGQFKDRSIIDMGCGDGFFTIQYWDMAQPREIVGVDMAQNAIIVANARKDSRSIRFEVADMHHISYPDNSFDLALIQSVLHHDDDPRDVIREGFRLAPEILIHEPNGHNPGLKLFEKVMPYHREHHEKSYSTAQMETWIKEVGG